MTTLIAGARGPFAQRELLEHIARVRKTHGVVLQAFDAGAIYGRAHLEAAVEKAERAHARGDGIAKDLATEIACYAAGDPQIAKALARVGVPARGNGLVLVALGDLAETALAELLTEARLTRDDAAVREDGGALERIGVTAAMRANVPHAEWALLAVERVALVDALK